MEAVIRDHVWSIEEMVCRVRRDRAESREVCQDFFAPWKDADPDIPILKEAKAEYAKRVLSSALSRRVKVPLALK